jgi:uncharacterized protein (TIGR02145 family)
MSIKYIPASLIILTLCCLNPCIAQPPTSATFIGGGGDNNFSNAANWSPAGVPVSGLEIIISAGATLVVDMDYSCTRLTVNAGSTFTCTGGHTLTVTDAIIDENGKEVIDISSSLVIGSSLKISEVLPTSGTFTDVRDGREYNWIRIGTQVWMAENLNYYTPTGSWYYNNDSATYSATYGRLYDGIASMAGESSSSSNPSGVQGVCPSGWHLPSDDEWKQLEMTLGMSQEQADAVGDRGTNQGEQMKTTYGWYSDGNGTNTSGFSGLPAGTRDCCSSSFFDILRYVSWRACTESSPTDAWGRHLSFNNPYVYRAAGSKNYGLSVRCVKN